MELTMNDCSFGFDASTVNAEVKNLKELFKKSATFDEGKKRFLLFHSKLYRSEMSGSSVATFEDILWDGLTDTIARTALNAKGRTIIYGLWHSTRIEDITMSILVWHDDQIYIKNNFKKQINAGIDHTGNSLSSEEILTMSSSVDIDALCKYRIEVGKKSQAIINALVFNDLKRKVDKTDIERIRSEGCVDDVPAANWLLDFWGNKTVEGILFMPACRHQLVHLRENFSAKENGLKRVRVS
jgi:hypothetical protein